MSENKMPSVFREYGRWLNRLRWKTDWRRYQEGNLTYSEFRHITFLKLNACRAVAGNEPFTEKKFDEGWQYRTVGHVNYKVAYIEMLNLIYGWW
jgi:hypothetical protein